MMLRCRGRIDLCGAFSQHSFCLVEVSMAVIVQSRALHYRDTDSSMTSMTDVDEDLSTDVDADVEEVFWMRFVDSFIA